MQIVVANNYDAMSRQAAERIAAAASQRPDLLLAAASGMTPTGSYERLSELHRQRPGLLDRLRVIKLDEWGGLAMNDPASCEMYLAHHLLGPLTISRDRFLSFQSDTQEPDTECARIRAALDSCGPIDLCVLGLGANGHVGFNEPADLLQPFAHVARLSESSLSHPMLAPARTLPHCGLTLGMAEIFGAREILLLVSGRHKAAPLQRLLSRRITTHFPASLLWLHSQVTCLCDADAAANP